MKFPQRENELMAQFEGFRQTAHLCHVPLLDEVFPFNVVLDDGVEISLSKLSNEQVVLGKRAEAFFLAWLSENEDFELIDNNIQVFDGQKTLGEFDFFVRRRSDLQVFHIEMVYKFYLWDPKRNDSELDHWIGPNQRDSLLYKLNKMEQQQFPLLKADQGRKILLEHGIKTDEVIQCVLFLAQLFIPENEDIDFGRLNPRTLEGRWYSHEMLDREHLKECGFMIPEKLNWFIRNIRDEWNWLEYTAFRQQLEKELDNEFSRLVWIRYPNGKIERCFIVWWS